MKSQYIMSVALVAASMIFGQVNAGEKELKKDQVPKEVIAAFEKAYPNAKGLEFEEETFAGKAAYEVEYKENGVEYEFLYSADGTLLQKEEEIDGKSLPEPVAQAVKKAHPKGEIKEVEQLMKPDGTVTGYEVEVKVAGKEIELELDVSGNILKTENE
ncbi:MAG: PepSY-like domain-containing protein [Methylococcaceae bacterium]